MAYDDVGVVDVPEEYVNYVICKIKPTDRFKYWAGGCWISNPTSNDVHKYNFNGGIAECFKLKNKDTYCKIKLVKLTTTVEDVELTIT